MFLGREPPGPLCVSNSHFGVWQGSWTMKTGNSCPIWSVESAIPAVADCGPMLGSVKAASFPVRSPLTPPARRTETLLPLVLPMIRFMMITFPLLVNLTFHCWPLLMGSFICWNITVRQGLLNCALKGVPIDQKLENIGA
jgi:hypothetical protein